MSGTITDDELKSLEFKTRDARADGLAIADQMRVVTYVRTLWQRVESLSQQYRIASNTAEQVAVPLAKVRALSAQHDRGEIDDTTLISGVKYWVTN
ncbi:hypothetical protein ACH47B_13090 [Rhodococcus sp. NPDC019627]|uniref:hypothetical protein n=1 Tax=unclassified Rhodococcus (in: high G+C Gram-positive bacteria) TaxID=192944 RepID=UPI0033E5E8E5